MGFSGSGMGQGAAGGAMMGAQTGNPYAAAGGAVIGGLMGAFGDNEGTPAQRVNSWLENPQYGWTQPLLEKQAGFYGSELDRIQSGQAPAYWSGLETSIRNQQQGDLNQNYFGREGERGAGTQLGMAQAQGAMLGTGPRGAQANITSTLKDYNQERSRIEDYITQLRSQSMENAYNTIPQGINNLDRGPQGQWDNYTIPGTAGSSLGGDLMSQGLSSGGLGDLGGMMANSGMGQKFQGTLSGMMKGRGGGTNSMDPSILGPMQGPQTFDQMQGSYSGGNTPAGMSTYSPTGEPAPGFMDRFGGALQQTWSGGPYNMQQSAQSQWANQVPQSQNTFGSRFGTALQEGLTGGPYTNPWAK